LAVPVIVMLARAAKAILFDAGTPDVPALVVSIAILLASAFIAAMAPAIRASRLDPMTAIRRE
jgi:ABC-type antimicrobial peptide transport system permease subunit